MTFVNRSLFVILEFPTVQDFESCVWKLSFHVFLAHYLLPSEPLRLGGELPSLTADNSPASIAIIVRKALAHLKARSLP